MYQNILIPVSFDEDRDFEQALKIAQQLAAPDARITVFHVIR